jgi:hypothetical protein
VGSRYFVIVPVCVSAPPVSGGVFVTGVFALFFSLFTVGFTREGRR